MTNLQLWHVYLTGHWQTCEALLSVDTSVLGSAYGVYTGRVVGLRFGGHVLAGGRVGCGLQRARASQGSAAASTKHRASLGPNGTRRDNLKINKPVSPLCLARCGSRGKGGISIIIVKPVGEQRNELKQAVLCDICQSF